MKKEFELKPCPFCAGPPRGIFREKPWPHYWLECEHCAACSNCFAAMEDAIRAWERRSDLATKLLFMAREN